MKTLLLSLLLLITSNSVFAMQNDARAKPDIDTLTATLQLNETQAIELKNLMRQHRQQMEILRDNSRTIRTQMKTKRDAHRENLLNILGYEQFYKFDNYMHQFHPHPHRNH